VNNKPIREPGFYWVRAKKSKEAPFIALYYKSNSSNIYYWQSINDIFWYDEIEVVSKKVEMPIKGFSMSKKKLKYVNVRKLGYYWIILKEPGNYNKGPLIALYDKDDENNFCWITPDEYFREDEVYVLSGRLECPLKAFL
jgi:hypothetical protein